MQQVVYWYCILDQPHYIKTTDQVSLDANSLTFTCSMDGHSSSKTYPRTSDPIFGQNVTPVAVTDL